MSDNDTQAVGGTAVWNIKGFSITLREEIARAARQQDCTIADWLHAHFHKHGVDGVEVEIPVKLAPALPANGFLQLTHNPLLAELREILELGRMVASVDDDVLGRRANRLLRAESLRLGRALKAPESP
jgi:hypothetical protein